MNEKEKLQVRHAQLDDGKTLCALLNEIIVIGGTTAFETELTVAEFNSHFLEGGDFINCLLVEHEGHVLGFQSLLDRPKLEAGWADIATFARSTPQVRGVGTALFESTIQFAVGASIDFINATIRADNQSGLSYYSKMGFNDYSVAQGVPLASGTRVDRISKKYTVSAG